MQSPSPGREQSPGQSQLNYQTSRPIQRSTRRSPEYFQQANAQTYGQGQASTYGAPLSAYGAPAYSGSASQSQDFVQPSPFLNSSYIGQPSAATYRGNTQASTQPAYISYENLLSDDIQAVGPPSQQSYQGNTQALTQPPSQPYEQQDPFQNRTKLDPRNFKSEKEIKAERQAEQARTRVRPSRAGAAKPAVPKPPRSEPRPRDNRVRKPYVTPARLQVPQQPLVQAPNYAMAPQIPMQSVPTQGPASRTYSLERPPLEPKAKEPRPFYPKPRAEKDDCICCECEINRGTKTITIRHLKICREPEYGGMACAHPRCLGCTAVPVKKGK